MLHTGYLYKMGEGPINYDWNKRFLVLDQDNRKLSYFLSESDKSARGHINLENSSVSQLMPIKGRKYSFCIKEGLKGKREINFSAENEKEAQTWISLINLWTPDDDLPIWETNKIDASRNTNVQIVKSDKVELDPKYSDNTDLFKKLQNKLATKSRATRKGRKTEHTKNKNKKLPRMTNVEKEVRLEKGSVAEFGEITNNFRAQLSVVEKYLMNDDWFKLYKFDKGSRITKHQTEKPFIVNKAVKKFYIAAVIIYLLDWIIFDFGFGFISLLIVLGILSYVKPIVKITKNNTVYRSSKVVDYSSKIIFEYLKSHYRQEVRFCGGRIFKDCSELSSRPEKQLIEYGFKFEPAFDDLSKILFQMDSKATAQQYWWVDENETRFILTQIEETVKTGVKVKYEEAFVIISSPSHPSQCLIYFFTNVGWPGSFLNEINPHNMTLLYMEENHEDDDAIDEEIDEGNNEVSILKRNVIQSNGVTEKVNQVNTVYRSGTIVSNNEEIDNVLRFDTRLMKGNAATYTRNKPPAKIFKEHPNNFRTNGVPCGLSERQLGYFRLEDGLLWCHNQEELSSQKGLVMDLLRKAGEKLMRGQGVVSISLPVRIFETRSALERCGDLWTCGPKYLPLAGKTNDPVERLKFIMCFMIGSMYIVTRQKKPFNPILGETFQAYWPDGTLIYMEHISHHPPISSFLVEHPDGLFKIEGSYTYTAILVNLGNWVKGRHSGTTRVHFKDGSIIEFEYPFLRINGLMIGKRTIQWEGPIKFSDKRNGLEWELNFPEKGMFGLERGTTYDMLTGKILQDGEEICDVEGSWLSHLDFNGKNYWTLENSDIIFPMRSENALASDCRFREDACALEDGDLDLAQYEKERLEVLQRSDKKLRTEGYRS